MRSQDRARHRPTSRKAPRRWRAAAAGTSRRIAAGFRHSASPSGPPLPPLTGNGRSPVTVFEHMSGVSLTSLRSPLGMLTRRSEISCRGGLFPAAAERKRSDTVFERLIHDSDTSLRHTRSKGVKWPPPPFLIVPRIARTLTIRILVLLRVAPRTLGRGPVPRAFAACDLFLLRNAAALVRAPSRDRMAGESESATIPWRRHGFLAKSRRRARSHPWHARTEPSAVGHYSDFMVSSLHAAGVWRRFRRNPPKSRSRSSSSTMRIRVRKACPWHASPASGWFATRSIWLHPRLNDGRKGPTRRISVVLEQRYAGPAGWLDAHGRGVRGPPPTRASSVPSCSTKTEHCRRGRVGSCEGWLAWNLGSGLNPDAPEFNYPTQRSTIALGTVSCWSAGCFSEGQRPASMRNTRRLIPEDSVLVPEPRRIGLRTYYQPRSEIIHYEGSFIFVSTLNLFLVSEGSALSFIH